MKKVLFWIQWSSFEQISMELEVNVNFLKKMHVLQNFSHEIFWWKKSWNFSNKPGLGLNLHSTKLVYVIQVSARSAKFMPISFTSTFAKISYHLHFSCWIILEFVFFDFYFLEKRLLYFKSEVLAKTHRHHRLVFPISYPFPSPFL